MTEDLLGSPALGDILVVDWVKGVDAIGGGRNLVVLRLLVHGIVLGASVDGGVEVELGRGGDGRLVNVEVEVVMTVLGVGSEVDVSLDVVGHVVGCIFGHCDEVSKWFG